MVVSGWILDGLVVVYRMSLFIAVLPLHRRRGRWAQATGSAAGVGSAIAAVETAPSSPELPIGAMQHASR